MDAEKATFLFPGMSGRLDDGDPVAVSELLDAGPDGASGNDVDRVLRRIALQQVADDAPPQVWTSARRLLASGMSRDDVLTQLVLAMVPDVAAPDTGDGPALGDAHLALLDRLPLPTADEVADVVVRLVRARPAAIAADELDAEVAEHFGVSSRDDHLTDHLLRMQDALIGVGGPLDMLHPDRVVHVASFVAEVTLTHRLSEPERAAGVLHLEPDLAPLDAHLDPRLPDGTALEHTGTDDGGVGWAGPPGWLDGFAAGSTIAVRATADGVVSVDEITTPDVPSADVTELVLDAYRDVTEESLLPARAQEILLAMLDRDRLAFDGPLAPLVELTAAAGLERRGEDFGHDESVWQAAAEVDRLRRIHDEFGMGPTASSVLDALEVAEDETADAGDRRAALDRMSDPEVLDGVTDELVGIEDERLMVAAAAAQRLLAAASRPQQRAVAHHVAAVVAERSGRVLDAYDLLRSAVREDPDWAPAVDRLAWYRSDSGDAAGALELLMRFGSSYETDQLESFAVPVEHPALGRNDRCWCGSGRKYKVCHLGRPGRAPLPDRVPWIWHKAEAFVARRGGAVRRDNELHAGAMDIGLDDTLVVDAVLVEGGWFERFLDERGPLLPEDEVMLARSWTLVSRGIHEIISIDGSILRFRDLRTGDRVEIHDELLSAWGHVGQMISARAVPDGVGHQFVGEVRVVPPGTEQQMLAILDDGDGLALVAHVGARIRAPRLSVAGDDGPMLACRAVLGIPDVPAARAALDELYTPRGDDVWLSTVGIADDEDRVLATVELSGSRLSVGTLTGARLDTVLAEVRTALPGTRLVDDRRKPVRVGEVDAASRSSAPPPMAPEAVDELQDRFERRWCDEQVPALGGRTPREAAADPTRREEVVRLIRSFPDIDPATGAFGLRPARLLALLDLDG